MNRFIRTPLIGMLALSSALVCTLARAEAPAPAPESQTLTASPDVQQQLGQLQQQMNQLSNALREIQQQTLQDNPQLNAQREAYIAQVDKAIEAQGVDVAAIRARLQWISNKAKSGKIEQSEADALKGEYQQKIRQLHQAEKAAMQDESISQAQQALSKAMIDSMTEQNADTPKMIAELQAAQGQYQALMTQMMQQQLKLQAPQQPGQ